MTTAAIIGAQGYSGRELARLLLRHPHIQLTHVFTRNPDWRLSEELLEPAAAQVQHGLVQDIAHNIPNVDMLFLATPHEASIELATLLYNKINWIIDLSGAFRLPVDIYDQWYQPAHTAKELAAMAQYGLCPWQSAAPSKLIANPGCYASAVLMALLPLAAAGWIQQPRIIIDAKSGISGAGRAAKTELLFAEVANNFYPYKIGKHQHTPEIQQAIQQFTQVQISPLLNTQVLPLMRGISAALYIPYQGTDHQIQQDLPALYAQAYANYPLVKHAYLPSLSAKAQHQLLALKNIAGSCSTHIAYQRVDEYLVVFSLLDNLLKGAASQAVENANRILNLPYTCGLENIMEGNL